jgi:hypothetical protein
VAEKKKREGWSKPVVKGPKKKPSTKTVMRKAEAQRRGMAETRRRNIAARPTLAQRRASEMNRKAARQDAMLNSPAAKRARERIRKGL